MYVVQVVRYCYLGFVLLLCLLTTVVFFVVDSSASDCLERTVPEMTCTLHAFTVTFAFNLYALAVVCNSR